MPVIFEKARLNVWNVGAIAVGIVISAFGWGITYATMVSNNTNAASDIDGLKSDVQQINDKLPSMQYRVDRLSEKSVEIQATANATNDRIDRVVEALGNKLDTISTNVNTIATRVEVLSSKIGDVNKPQRSLYIK